VLVAAKNLHGVNYRFYSGQARSVVAARGSNQCLTLFVTVSRYIGISPL
jgi:hypothetical protein